MLLLLEVLAVEGVDEPAGDDGPGSGLEVLDQPVGVQAVGDGAAEPVCPCAVNTTDAFPCLGLAWVVPDRATGVLAKEDGNTTKGRRGGLSENANLGWTYS